MKKIIAGIVLGVVALSLIVCAGVGIAMAKSTMNKLDDMQSLCQSMENGVEDLKDKNKELMAYVDEAKKEEEKETEPQYVTIDAQYEIKDTSAISDAYISGNTDDLSAKDKETLKMAQDVLNEVTKPEMSTYEKELAIYTWMKKNITFDSSSLMAVINPDANCYTPYGVLKSKKAVCVGYATTFKLFMNMMGLECMVEHDKSLSHSWDIVKLDDGEWYLCDLVFDNGNKTPLYNTFNCTNTQFEQGHEWDKSLYPIANGLKYSYANQNAKDCALKDMPKKIKEQMQLAKTNSSYYRLPAGVDTDYLMQMVSGIETRIMNNMMEGSFSSTMTVDENGRYVVGALFNFYDESEEETPSSGNAELDKMLDELFGTTSGDGDDYDYDYDYDYENEREVREVTVG